MNGPKKRIDPLPTLLLKIGCFSRLFTFLLQMISNLFPDHNADAFKPPLTSDNNNNNNNNSNWSVDSLVRDYLLGGFAKWDSLHMLHVAEFGYLFESDLAFFPGFPLTLRGIDAVLLQPVLEETMEKRTRLLIAAVLVNNLAFVVSGVALYHLSRRWVSPTASFVGVAFFYFNPASIFFSAAYSESLFFASSVSALLLFHRGSYSSSAVMFALCGAIRSNGVIFVGFFWFSWINRVYETTTTTKTTTTTTSSLRIFCRIILETVKTMFLTGVSISLFLVYQFYAASVFCHRTTTTSTSLHRPEAGAGAVVPSHLRQFAFEKDALVRGARKFVIFNPTPAGNDENYTETYLTLTPADFPAWCNNNNHHHNDDDKRLFFLPRFSYSAVQSKYWDLGFLAYYRIEQIPNFLLALPIVLLTFACLKDFIDARVLLNVDRAKTSWKHRILAPIIVDYGCNEERVVKCDYGINEEPVLKRDYGCNEEPVLKRDYGINEPNSPSSERRKMLNSREGLYRTECVPFYVYTCFLLVFGLCFMHVQVLTRLLLSSSPILCVYVGARFCQSSSSSTEDDDVTKLSTLVCSDNNNRNEGVFVILSKIVAIAKHNSPFRRFVLGYCVSYIVVGTIMHCSFLPWT